VVKAVEKAVEEAATEKVVALAAAEAATEKVVALTAAEAATEKVVAEAAAEAAEALAAVAVEVAEDQVAAVEVQETKKNGSLRPSSAD